MITVVVGGTRSKTGKMDVFWVSQTAHGSRKGPKNDKECFRIKNHKAHLKTFDVQFDENDQSLLDNDENTGKGEPDVSNKIDSFRKANAALKKNMKHTFFTNYKILG